LPFGARRIDAATVYFIMVGARAFIQGVLFTALTIYFVTAAGLDPLQLVLVGTVLEAAYLLSEVPTGVIADVYSRRLSIILGHLLFGIGYVIQGLFPVFWIILVAEVIRAIGEACQSGATEAWLADEAGEEHLGTLLLRGAQVGRACILIGIGASVALASIQISLPIVVGGLLSIALAGFLALVMPEQRFRPLARTGRWSDLYVTARTGLGEVRRRPLLLAFLAIAAAIGASSEGFDRLWEAHLLASFTFPEVGDFQPIVWFGILYAAGHAIAIVAIQVVARLRVQEDRQIARVALIAHAGWLVAVIVLGLASSFAVAVAALLTARVLKSIGKPLMDTWITRSIPSQVRATVLSSLSQGDAFGQIAGGPVVGAIGTAYSLRAAIVTTGLLHAPVLLLLTRARRLLSAPVPTSAGAELDPRPGTHGAGAS
jgi:DHA3 family tetracycline resistance protein-like MFS transporter